MLRLFWHNILFSLDTTLVHNDNTVSYSITPVLSTSYL